MKNKVVRLFIIIFVLCISLSGIILYCLNKYDIIMDTKSIALIDEYTPTLTVKEDKIYVDLNEEYNPYDNIISSFGKLGGEVVCDEVNLKLGRNDITCTATSNNKMKTSKIFSVYKTATKEKSAIFFGDSITAGFGSDFHFSWADYIETDYDLVNCENAGINDYRVSTYQRPNKWLGLEVLNHYDDKENYDFVILQGGINDALISTPLGELATSFNSEELDTNTFYGGLEKYILNVINRWPNSKIGYIITYYIPNYDDHIYSYNHFKTYYEALKRVLVKYNIPYLDLFAGKSGVDKYSDILKIDTTIFLEDNLHLNDEGYKQIAPYIYSWMQTIPNYNKVF